MTGKIAAAFVAATVLATAGAASAQTLQAPSRSYFNNDYWSAVANTAPVRAPLRDSFAGTVFEGVAPY